MTIADDCSRYPLSVILAIPPAFVPVKSLRAEEVAGKDLAPVCHADLSVLNTVGSRLALTVLEAACEVSTQPGCNPLSVLPSGLI